MRIDDMKIFCNNSITSLLQDMDDWHFKGRSFYGEMFFALALSSSDKVAYENIVCHICEEYNKLEKSANNFHWEFNNYAMLKLIKLYPELNGYLAHKMKFKGTKCTNWSLLRITCKIMIGESTNSEDPVKLINKMQLPNGLILDESNVSSFQYHCFMAAIIYELYSITGNEFYYDSFIKAIHFIKNFTFFSGDTLYIGRGQEQIFGYGTLIYIYSLAYQETMDIQYLVLLNRVFSYISRYQLEETTLPLVLNHYEKKSKETLLPSDQNHLGWYTYNNYYDYLPFFSYYLAEAIRLLQKYSKDLELSLESEKYKTFYADRYFLRYSDTFWEIALGCYKGASANSLVFPLITFEGNEISSCCGGEDYADLGYQQYDTISLPCGKYKSKIRYVFNSKNFVRSILKNIIRRKKISYVRFLWELGQHEIITTDSISNFGVHSESKDYSYDRSIRVSDCKIEFEESIVFRKNILYESFIPFKIMFQKINEIQKNKIYSLGNVYLKIETEIDVNLLQKKYMTSKGMVDMLYVQIDNLKVRKGECLFYKYSIIKNEE